MGDFWTLHLLLDGGLSNPERIQTKRTSGDRVVLVFVKQPDRLGQRIAADRVAGDPGPLPEPKCEATPLDGVDYVVAPHAGIITYRKAPGDPIKAGEVVAEIIDPAADDPAAARHELKSQVDGILVGRHLMKFALPGERICKIAGAEPLANPEDWSKLED